MTLFIDGHGVRLEAILREPRGQVRGAAVLCHPHPAYGGTMDNRVIFRAATAVQAAHLAALRFNFRGAGASSGTYDEGIGEKDDVAAAINWLEKRCPGLPMALVGFSFGAWVGLQVACSDSRIKALIGLGLPLNFYDFEFLADNDRPALFIVGNRDEFCPMEKLDFLERLLPSTSEVRRVEGADHFFASELEQVQALIADFLGRIDFEGTAK